MMNVFEQVPPNIFRLHPSIEKAVAEKRIKLMLGGVDLLQGLQPEILTQETVEYRSTHLVDDISTMVVVGANHLEPKLYADVYPIYGNTGLSTALFERRPLKFEIPGVQGSFEYDASPEGVVGHGQGLRPLRLIWNFQTGEINVMSHAYDHFHSTSHVPAYQNQTGVGDYFSFDHHAERNDLGYWRAQVDGMGNFPLHFIHKEGHVGREEDWPNLIFGGPGWAHQHSRGFDTEYWIKHSQKEPWHDKPARDQWNRSWSLPDTQHFSFDPCCQAYIQHEDPMHGLFVEFSTETSLMVVPPADDGKGTAGNKAGSARSRARIIKTFLNQWLAMLHMANRKGLVEHRREHILTRTDRLVQRGASRLIEQIRQWKEDITKRGEPWIWTGKHGQPKYFSTQEHALYAGSISMLREVYGMTGATFPHELDTMRQQMSKFVLDDYGLRNSAGEWDPNGTSWAIPYKHWPDGSKDHPASGWIFTVEMLRAMEADDLKAADREKWKAVWNDVRSRRGADDWVTPEIFKGARVELAVA